jgi:hypothetical protein
VTAEPVTDPRDREIAALRARVAELEAELHAQAARTAATVAEAQEKLYWLERWHVDLDKLMAKPGAVPALDTLKRARGVVRSTRRLKRRLLGS